MLQGSVSVTAFPKTDKEIFARRALTFSLRWPVADSGGYNRFSWSLAMSTAPIPASLGSPETVDKKEVLQQLERLLNSSHFRGSRRSSAFFQYVVQKSIDGPADRLKERTIGIEVFHREPSFDTAADCIVRVVASEVRKRLAQFYQEPGHNRELYIDLPPGSYVPHFHPPQAAVPTLQSVASPPPSIVANPTDVPAPSFGLRHLAVLLSSIAAVALLSYIGFRYWSGRASQSDLLAPFVSSPQPVTICVAAPELTANQPGAESPDAQVALGHPPKNNTLIPFADTMALSRVQAILFAHQQDSDVLLADSATFDALRFGPSIMIGALDNPWTMRLAQGADHRFYFKGTDANWGEIVDRESKSGQHWFVDFKLPYSDRTQDYAIVSVTDDGTLGRPLLVLAGIGPNGTMAAGEFLIHPGSLDSLRKMAPAGWSGKNFEVVLGTPVISGVSGPPKILATHFW